MGVQNLWQLLLPIGRRINIETLEGKALAVDVSIWLIQFIRVMRDEEGKMVKNAHLIGTLRRILKLLFHRIRPVFVFDGSTPELKRRTVQHRRVLRERQEHNLRKAAEKILVAQLKQAALAAKLKETGTIPAIAPPAPAQPAQYSSSFVASSRGTAGANAGASAAAVAAVGAAASQSSTAAETAGNDEDDEDFDNIAWESAEETVNVRPKPLDEDAASSDSEDAWFVPDNELDIDVDALAALPAHIRKEMILIARRRHRLKARADFVPVSEDPAMYSQTQIAHFLRTSRLNERIYEVQQRTSSMEPGRTIAASENRKYIIMKDDEFVSDVEEERVDADGAAVVSTHTHTKTATHSVEVVVSSSPSSPSQRGEGAEDIPAVMELGEDDDWETTGGGFFGDQVTSGSLHIVKPVEPPTIAAAVIAEEMKEATQPQNEAAKQAEVSHPKPKAMILDENGEWVDAEERLRLARRKKRVEFLDMSSEHDEASEAVKRLRELAETSKKQKANPPATTPVVEVEVAEPEAPEPAPEVDDGSFWEDATTITPSASTQRAPQAEQDVEAVEDSTAMDLKRKEPVIVIRFERPRPSTVPLTTTTTTTPLAAMIQPSTEIAKQPDERTERTEPISRSVIEEAPESQVSETMTTAAFPEAAETTQEETQEETQKAQAVEETHKDEDEEHEEEDEEEGAEDELQGRSSDEPLINDPALMERINEEMSQLEHERDLLQQQRRAAMRDTERMTEEMKEEVLEMLQVLGLPYIVAPMEAEAQCAVLEALGVVDGVVTEDSDAFLFGAQTVYKNIFDERKYVEVFLASDAERELGITRNEFIALAYLLGSDYTPGVRGVGIVNAMEVLHAFPCKEDPIEGLKEFKKWLGGFDITEELGLKGTEADSLDTIKRQFHQKHRGLRSRWQADDNFPDERVAKAYLRPQVVSDATKFEWPVPEIVRVKEYCRQRLGWTDAEIDKTVVPAIANFATTKVQKRIDSYYVSYHDNIQFARIRSNRLRTAVGSMTGQVPEPSSRLVSLPGTVVGGKRSAAQSDSPVRAAGSGADTTPKRQRKQRRRKAATSWEDSTSDSEAEPMSPEKRGATGTRQRRKRKSG